MEQQNICKASQLTRARALELGVPFTVPPAPSLTGTWRTPSGDVEVVDDFRTGIITVDGDASFFYETDINEAIVGTGGRRAVLEDGGYALRWHTDSVWTRRDEVRTVQQNLLSWPKLAQTGQTGPCTFCHVTQLRLGG
jgi:hypothetical protein